MKYRYLRLFLTQVLTSSRIRKASTCMVLLILAIALIAGLLLSANKVSAKGLKNVLFVGLTAGSNTSCASPGFTHVQAAVDAANPGDTVYLCGANTYSEQVIITKSITLTGDDGATIKAPTPFPTTDPSRLPGNFTSDNLDIPKAVVIIWGAEVNVTIRNLIVAGTITGTHSCAESEFGVLVIANGAANLIHDQVIDIRDTNTTLAGCQFGNGIQIGREYWPKADFSTFVIENFVGHAQVIDTTVARYQKDGIIVDGPGSTGVVSHNIVNGFGRDAIYGVIIAQNGIQISRGAKAVVTGNTVTGNSYTGPAGASATGILIFGGCGDPLVTRTRISENVVTNNDIGIGLYNLESNCNDPVKTPTRVSVLDNTITNDAVTNTSGNSPSPGGYQAGIQDQGDFDSIIANEICGPGYTTPSSSAAKIFTIDITATNHPIVLFNHVCGESGDQDSRESSHFREQSSWSTER